MPEGQTSVGAVVRLRDPAVAAASRATPRSWQLAVWVALQVVVGIVCTQLPLFGVLGYELAVAAAPLAAVTGLGLGITLSRRAPRSPAPALLRARGPGRLILALTGRAAALAAVVTAIPAVFAAIHGLWTPTCAWGFGVEAYLVMPTTSAILGAAAGVVIGLLSGHRTWVAVTAAIALVLALAVACLWRFYSEPPVFLYSPLFGYFPGNLYDENIRLGWPLLWSRVEQVAWLLGALAITAAILDAPTLRPRLRERRPAGWRIPALGVAIAFVGAGVALHAASGRLGYAIDAEDIQAELGGVVESEHFVIYYADVEEVTADLDLLVEDHELRLAQVAATLELTDDDLARLGKLTSYIFASDDQKGRLMGARRVEMAKPWRREIYLSFDGFPLNATRHELAHVVAGLFGSDWFHVSADSVAGLPLLFNPGLIEGLAVAVDWPGSSNYRATLTPHQAMRAMQLMGNQPSVGDVMSLGFLAFSSPRAYTAAGSFVKYLLDRYGARALRRLYGTGGDFELAYGHSLASLERAWRDMISAVPITDAQVEMVREAYRGTGVFSRPCPHAIAARQEEAADAARRGDVAAAIALRRSVCSDSPGEPQYRLDLAATLTAGDDAQRAEGVAMFEALAADEALTSSMRAAALRGLASLAAGDEDWAQVEARLAAAYALPLGDEEARDLEARLIALRATGPAAAALRGYFYDSATLEQRAASATQATALEPALGLAWYLRGFTSDGDPPAQIQAFTTALGLDLPSTRFVRNAARLLADAAWRADDGASIERAAEVLSRAEMTEMDHALADDLRAKLRWRRSRA